MLHVLNGEGTASRFRSSEIDGDIVVWNEALVDGSVKAPLFSEEFFRQRIEYISQFTDSGSYNEIVLAEFRKLETTKSTSATLWFEYDLFCQINLIALLAWLENREQEVFLVCIDRHPHHPDFRGLGQLSSDQLAALYNDRVPITADTMKYASQLWKAYCSDNPLQLLNCIFHSKGCRQLPFLKRAFLEHFRRFPSIENGLNNVQNQILNLATSKISYTTLISNLLSGNNHLGYGDLQYQQEIDRVIPFIKVANNEIMASATIPTLKNTIPVAGQRTIGGAKASEWCWDDIDHKLSRR